MYRVKVQRILKGMSQEELAKKAGVSRAIISKMECDDTAPVRTDTLEKISKALQVPVNEIFLP